MNETYIIPTVIDGHNTLPETNDTEPQSEDNPRHRRRCNADDIIVMQTAVCMLIAAALIITNIFRHDISYELFSRLLELSESPHELFRNPVELLLSLRDK